jgi:two-component system, cell cycle response regulator
MGGDEFTIILEGLSHEDDLVVIARRITQSLSAPFTIQDQQISIGVSIGITTYPTDDHEIDDLLRHADTAMYRAKQRGGNAFEFHISNDSPPSTLSSKSS